MELSVRIEDIDIESATQLIAALDAELLNLDQRLSEHVVGPRAGKQLASN